MACSKSEFDVNIYEPQLVRKGRVGNASVKSIDSCQPAQAVRPIVIS